MNRALDKIIEETFIVYAGCLIEKKGAEFIAIKKSFKNIDQAKKHIDQSFAIIQKSINH